MAITSALIPKAGVASVVQFTWSYDFCTVYPVIADPPLSLGVIQRASMLPSVAIASRDQPGKLGAVAAAVIDTTLLLSP